MTQAYKPTQARSRAPPSAQAHKRKHMQDTYDMPNGKKERETQCNKHSFMDVKENV